MNFLIMVLCGSTMSWNPWNVSVVHTSDLFLNKFQSWDNFSADSKPRQKAWNRAQKWLSDILKLPCEEKPGNKLRVIYKDNAFKFLIESMH